MDSSADKAALARCLSFSLLWPELISLNRQRFYCLVSAALVRSHFHHLYAMVRQNTVLGWTQWSKAPYVMEDRKQKEETRDKISPSWESALWPSLSIRVSPPKVSTTSWYFHLNMNPSRVLTTWYLPKAPPLNMATLRPSLYLKPKTSGENFRSKTQSQGQCWVTTSLELKGEMGWGNYLDNALEI